MNTRLDRTTDELILSGTTGRLLALLASGSFIAFLGRGAIPPLLPAIVEDLSISSAEAGVGLSLLWLAYAASQYPGGRFSDELSRKTTLVFSLTMMVVGFLVLISSVSYIAFVAGVVLVGLGHGVYYPSARGLIADMFVRRRSQAIGIQMGATAAGTTVSAGVAILALSMATWNAAFVPVVAGLFLIAVLMHRWNREPYRLARVTMEPDQMTLRIFGSRRILFALVAYAAFAITWQGAVSFLPTFLHVDKGFSLAIGSTAYALIYGVGMLVSPLAGNLGDRFSRTYVCMGTLIVCTIGYSIFVFASNIVVVFAGIAVFATGMWAFPPVVQALLLSEFANDSMGADLGGFKTVYTGIGSIGPAYVGFVAEWSSYTLAFAGFILCLLVSLIAFTIVWRT